eukprot:CAMPEP_0197422458 /NCGR_PEP_ID=MMETSP1170-20131217/15975_1 /TAXON_ID=54406 /ORGANISM="Sarcinochrysis sp, Strain CCMP770" /LENGTH=100 /DNA_ID=CAMNT_0042949793 /DNA_START=155 /DNA_END=455 /DNA_ORIENTATION=+
MPRAPAAPDGASHPRAFDSPVTSGQRRAPLAIQPDSRGAASSAARRLREPATQLRSLRTRTSRSHWKGSAEKTTRPGMRLKPARLMIMNDGPLAESSPEA